jgi:hypothetical protein
LLIVERSGRARKAVSSRVVDVVTRRRCRHASLSSRLGDAGSRIDP